MPKLWEMLFGKGDKMSQVSTKTPQQTQAINSISQTGGLSDNAAFGAGSDFLQRLFGGDISAFEGPLMQQFNQQIIPDIAERFGGMGAGSSSGLNQALSQAAENLQTQLGAQRSQLMLSALPQLLQFAQQPINNQLNASGMGTFENVYQQGDYGLFGGLMQSAAPGFGAFGQAVGKNLGNRLFPPSVGR